MTIRVVYAPIVASIFLAACGTYTPREVADPHAITLNAALVDVADSLNDMRARTDARGKLGMLVDEVSVTFNVSTTAVRGDKLGVAAAIPNTGVSFSGSDELTNTGNRGNQITVKLKNIATADMSKSSKEYVRLCYGANNRPIRCPKDLLVQ